jgi:hypothetical protein
VETIYGLECERKGLCRFLESRKIQKIMER